MFKTIKNKANILKVFEKYFETELIPSGSDTWEPEDKECPFCQHKDCFKIKYIEEPAEEEFSFWSCFSEGLDPEFGESSMGQDVISLVARKFELEQYDAALKIAKDFDIEIPRSENKKLAEMFTVIADYYHNILMENNTAKEIPIRPQTRLCGEDHEAGQRGRDLGILKQENVGYSDGKLHWYLSSLGYSLEDMLATGLINAGNRHPYDKIPVDSVVFPIYYNGQVSRFRWKCFSKDIKFQQVKDFWLTKEVEFYGMDSVEGKDNVVIVEGEHDRLAILETKWDGAVLATLGQITSFQLKWLGDKLQGKNVYTLVDNDDGGQNYEIKIKKKNTLFGSFTILRNPEGYKDIDEYVVKTGYRGDLKELVHEVVDRDPNAPDITTEDDELGKPSIYEKNGRYLKVKRTNDSAYVVPVSNFVMKLTNVFLKNNQRSREVRIIKCNGYKSQPILIDSETKVGIRQFKTLVANAADASFTGSEADLNDMWDLVYEKSDAKEVIVPEVVGRADEIGGWVFSDIFMADNGAIAEPKDGDGGVMWLPGTGGVGVRPTSLFNNAAAINNKVGVPEMYPDMDTKESEMLLKEVVSQLSINLGSPGMALTMLGWTMATAYSNIIYEKEKLFPFLLMWGRHGKGKTNILKWLLSFYDMQDHGYETINNLSKSVVGFTRKASYYASLPLSIDELRSDRHSKELGGFFRGWYNRAGRTKGVKETFGAVSEAVRSTFIFCGQDIFSDQATMSRTIPLKIPTNGRELKNSYQWIESNTSKLKNIGFRWIQSSIEEKPADIYKELADLQRELSEMGAEERMFKNWSISGMFGLRLAKKYMPDFDYVGYMVDAMNKVQVEQRENNMIVSFFEIVEGLASGERPLITSDHLQVDGDSMYVWFDEIFRIVNGQIRSDEYTEKFTKSATKSAMYDELYVKPCPEKGLRKTMGYKGIQRRVIEINIKYPDIPGVFLNLAETVST